MDPAIKGTLTLIARELEKMNDHLAVQNRLQALELRRKMYPSEKAYLWVGSVAGCGGLMEIRIVQKYAPNPRRAGALRDPGGPMTIPARPRSRTTCL